MQEISLDLRHLTLSALRFGNPNGPKVLALHGWLDNAASFVPVADYLNDWDVVALDLAGHGHSAHRSADAHYHLLDWVQDIHEVLHRLGWSSCHFLGHSLGGIIASLYAATFSEQVQSLTMIEAFGPLSLEPESSVTQLRESVLSRLAIDEKPARHPPSLAKAITARLLAGDLSKAAARLLVERNLVEQEDVLMWRTDRRLRTISSLRLTEPQAQAFLAAIQCPVMAVLGEQGFEKVRNNLNRRRELIAQLSDVNAQGGHHVHMDNPETVAEHIRCFWQQVASH
ncbi:alpha/beta fold hydrolase [Bowmanella pacifica]|uniref:Alpha/beta hydrolase n=1 Tax=Bowmanella pacifica TaxID=502051 RepID=A0A917Z3W4_9ALTE|nr:alpha/beta hydrolase [Bowmanella pacifica]GGO74407.1 alpha/beta hydrolase [Bowmanella pacifica]